MMNLKSKIQAAANRAANGPGDPKSKNNNPVPNKNTSYGNKVPMNPSARQKFDASKQQYMASTMKKKEAPMSSMPTLRPTSVSVSAEKRTAAPLAGKAPVGNTKRRG
jgi:hypothetical protein